MNPADGSTILGKSVVIHGELSGSEDLFIAGEIKGSINLGANRLTVGPGARVLADIHVRDLIVLGYVQGHVHATGRIELRQTARVEGDLFATRLSIEESAILKGRVELTGSGTSAIPIPAGTP